MGLFVKTDIFFGLDDPFIMGLLVLEINESIEFVITLIIHDKNIAD